MIDDSGYIYVRYHEAYDKYDACKLGKATSIWDRDNTYKTGEIKCGKFELVLEFKKGREKYIETLLQDEFKNLHVYINGGTEFYCKKIKELIVPFLNKHNILFKLLTNEELDEINRTKRNHNDKIKYKVNIKNLIKYVLEHKMPNPQQLDILNKVKDFFSSNNMGKIIWSCGLGKTLLSIFIIEKLKLKTIVIGVPSIYLQKQFIMEILKIYPKRENILCVGGDIKDAISEIDDVNSFIIKRNNDKEPLFVLTTYTSCHLLVNEKIKFDFAIGDEAHHLVGVDSETKNYKLFHNIKRSKTLFMTATEKNIGIKCDQQIYSMDDETIFGKYIDKKSVNWAIENKKITDFAVLILSNTEREIDNIIQQLGINVRHKDLFMVAFMTLKSFEEYEGLTHTLVCCNKTESADIINNYVSMILDKNVLTLDKKDVYHNSLHSNKKININPNDKNSEITKFKQSKYGIISSVYIFGEGFDLPKLNGVVFAENMMSDIRIVQTSLRPNRLDTNQPNKLAHVIIPYLECNDINADIEAFNRVRMVIGKLRNVDEQIEQKINVAKIQPCNVNKKSVVKYNYEFYDDQNMLDTIKLKLIHSRALGSRKSVEQDEYDYMKALNKEMNICSKEEYSSDDIKNRHKNYIQKPEEYFKSKGVWDNWYDFLGYDTSVFIQSKEKWIEFCKENKININNYRNACQQYACLPMNPSDFYKDFSNILSELGTIFKRR